jgi:hypothetical protein
MKLVKEFFKGDTYAGEKNAIAKYAKWATRSNGPGIWGLPTPMDCVIDESSPEYIVLYPVLFASSC